MFKHRPNVYLHNFNTSGKNCGFALMAFWDLLQIDNDLIKSLTLIRLVSKIPSVQLKYIYIFTAIQEAIKIKAIKKHLNEMKY